MPFLVHKIDLATCLFANDRDTVRSLTVSHRDLASFLRSAKEHHG